MTNQQINRNGRPITRRAFVQGAASVGLVAGAAPILAACAPVMSQAAQVPIALPTPTLSTTNSFRSRVALVRTDNRATGVRRAVRYRVRDR